MCFSTVDLTNFANFFEKKIIKSISQILILGFRVVPGSVKKLTQVTLLIYSLIGGCSLLGQLWQQW
jgi:hypothetical protein